MAKPKRPRDTNQLAKFVVELATGQISEPDPYAGKDRRKVDSGSLGGKKGGAERARNLTKEKRHEIATQAAEARWHKKSD
jgi:hypothetical protein